MPRTFGCACRSVRVPLKALFMSWLVANVATTFTFGQFFSMRSLNERTRISWLSWPGFSVAASSPLPPIALARASAAAYPSFTLSEVMKANRLLCGESVAKVITGIPFSMAALIGSTKASGTMGQAGLPCRVLRHDLGVDRQLLVQVVLGGAGVHRLHPELGSRELEPLVDPDPVLDAAHEVHEVVDFLGASLEHALLLRESADDGCAEEKGHQDQCNRLPHSLPPCRFEAGAHSTEPEDRDPPCRAESRCPRTLDGGL